MGEGLVEAVWHLDCSQEFCLWFCLRSNECLYAFTHGWNSAMLYFSTNVFFVMFTLVCVRHLNPILRVSIAFASCSFVCCEVFSGERSSNPSMPSVICPGSLDAIIAGSKEWLEARTLIHYTGRVQFGYTNWRTRRESTKYCPEFLKDEQGNCLRLFILRVDLVGTKGGKYLNE